MERFLKRHQRRVIGTIAGFDRILFRGTLRSISYINGMEIFLSSQRVLLKAFAQFAQRLSALIKAHAETIAANHKRPYRYIESSALSKEDIAKQIMEQDGITEGLICVLTCVEPCQTFSIRRDRESKKLMLAVQQRKCLHIYFYYVDSEFGFMHVRLQTWLPFTIQVYVNGREWLARQMDRAGIRYTQRDNCFTKIEDLAAAQRLMDSLTTRKWGRLLTSLARRVNPIIDRRAGFNLKGYYWSIRQAEYATDVMFENPNSLAQVYPGLIRHAIEQFSSQDVLRFLGRRVSSRFNKEVTSSLQKRVEGLRIKHRVEENSIKMYDKGSVLRIETTINNPARFKVRRRVTRYGQPMMGWLRLRKGIADLKRRVQLSTAANERYLEALAVVGEPTPSHRLLDPVSRPVIAQGRTYRGLRPISPDDSRVFQAVLKGEYLIQGIRNGDLRKDLLADEETDPVRRRKASARISRTLRLLKAHGLIYKVPKTHYHRITKKGQEIMTTATTFRESNIALLAAS